VEELCTKYEGMVPELIQREPAKEELYQKYLKILQIKIIFLGNRENYLKLIPFKFV